MFSYSHCLSVQFLSRAMQTHQDLSLLHASTRWTVHMQIFLLSVSSSLKSSLAKPRFYVHIVWVLREHQVQNLKREDCVPLLLHIVVETGVSSLVPTLSHFQDDQKTYNKLLHKTGMVLKWDATRILHTFFSLMSRAALSEIWENHFLNFPSTPGSGGAHP